MSSRDDVRTLVDETADHGAIEPEEQQMIHSVIGLQDRQAKEIMQPRINVKALPETARRDELLALSAETGRTRIPIYQENIDSIIGIVNTYDILADPEPDNSSWDRFIRPAQRVPDSMKLDDLLEHLKAEKQHFAVVIDEYGGTDGIVTMEDILEEIFGEIEDEHDPEEKPIRKIGELTFIIDARMPLVDAAAFMNIDLEDDSVETIGGWVMRHAGRIPAPGEVITHNGYKMTILEGDRNVVSRIRLEIDPKREASSAHPTSH
jgi:putative hemolysin